MSATGTEDDLLPDQQLTAQGLNLQALLPINDIDVDLPAAAAGHSHLLVLGHGGKAFWAAAQFGYAGTDPLDHYATQCTLDFLERQNISAFELLYPRDALALDLRRLGAELGWHFDSPLGIGIHPEFGLWFGYRAVVAMILKDAPDTDHCFSEASHPCEACISKPCVAACPVGAVGDRFDLHQCIEHRAAANSVCADQCLARNACPHGVEYRYDPGQIQYHYRISLQAIRSHLLD